MAVGQGVMHSVTSCETIIDPGTASVFVTSFSDLHFLNSGFRINGQQLAGGYIADVPQAAAVSRHFFNCPHIRFR